MAELRLFPFFGLQLEALFPYDAFSAVKTISEDGDRRISSAMFSTMSLTFPVMLKVPVEFERFALSFYAGAYYWLFFSWREEGESGGGGGMDDFSVSFPLGVIIGADTGIPLGPG